MTSIVATLIAAAPLPYIQIDVVIDNPGDVTQWTITRLAPPTADVMIRLAYSSGGAESLEDHEAPLAVAIAYRLDVTRASGATETVQSNQVAIEGTTGCFLSDPYGGDVMAIEVQAWPERLYAARASVLEVIGRADPVGLSDVHSWAQGTWTLLTRTDAATDQMINLLGSSSIVLLRTQPTSSIKTVYAMVLDIAEARYSGSGADQRRLTDVDLQEIAPIPAMARALDSTLLGLSTLAETLQGLSQVRPTLLQLSQIRTG
jgi:hypothetical protein